MTFFWYDYGALILSVIAVLGIIIAFIYATQAIKDGFSEGLSAAMGFTSLFFIVMVLITVLVSYLINPTIKGILYGFSLLGLFPVLILCVIVIPWEKLFEKKSRR